MLHVSDFLAGKLKKSLDLCYCAQFVYLHSTIITQCSPLSGRIQDFPVGGRGTLIGGRGTPRGGLHFIKFVCQNERNWVL